jgi:hypothetical protein
LKEDALDKVDDARQNLRDHFNKITRTHYLYSTINVTHASFDTIPSGVLGVIASKLKAHEMVHFRDALGLAPESDDFKAVTAVAEEAWAAQRAARLVTKSLFRTWRPLSEGAASLINQLHARQEWFDIDLYEFMKTCVKSVGDFRNKKLQIIDVGFNVQYSNGKISFCVRSLVREQVDMLTEYKLLRQLEKNVGAINQASWGAYHVVEYPLSYDPDESTYDILPEYDIEVFETVVGDINDWFDEKLTFSVNEDGDIQQRRFTTTEAGMDTFPINDGVPFDPVEHLLLAFQPHEDDELLSNSESEEEDDDDIDVIDLTDD